DVGLPLPAPQAVQAQSRGDGGEPGLGVVRFGARLEGDQSRERLVRGFLGVGPGPGDPVAHAQQAPPDPVERGPVDTQPGRTRSMTSSRTPLRERGSIRVATAILFHALMVTISMSNCPAPHTPRCRTTSAYRSSRTDSSPSMCVTASLN